MVPAPAIPRDRLGRGRGRGPAGSRRGARAMGIYEAGRHRGKRVSMPPPTRVEVEVGDEERSRALLPASSTSSTAPSTAHAWCSVSYSPGNLGRRLRLAASLASSASHLRTARRWASSSLYASRSASACSRGLIGRREPNHQTPAAMATSATAATATKPHGMSKPPGFFSTAARIMRSTAQSLPHSRGHRSDRSP